MKKVPHKVQNRDLSASAVVSTERAERFVALLNSQSWTQSKAASELQITRNHVNMIVNGKATPSAALLALLESKVKTKEDLDPRLAEINAYLRTLTSEQKERVLECLDQVVNLQRKLN